MVQKLQNLSLFNLEIIKYMAFKLGKNKVKIPSKEEIVLNDYDNLTKVICDRDFCDITSGGMDIDEIIEQHDNYIIEKYNNKLLEERKKISKEINRRNNITMLLSISCIIIFYFILYIIHLLN